MVDLDQFRLEVRRFFELHAKRRGLEQESWGTGSDAVGLLSQCEQGEEDAELEAAREWRQRLAEAGLHWISGPAELGGRGLTPAHEEVFADVAVDFDIPSQGPFFGLGMLAPTIFDHAQPSVRDEVVPGLYRGDLIACQLFSEPGAGSDLANIQTKALRVSGGWRVTGQKVWSSGAHYADIGELIARTDPDAAKHKGLSAFVIDMHQPGVVVRPLREMSGKASFNEVFLDDAFVREDQLLGQEGQGWLVAMATMGHERSAIGSGGGGAGNSRSGNVSFEHILRTAREYGGDATVRHRERLAELYTAFRVNELTRSWLEGNPLPSTVPGAGEAVGKLLVTRNLTRISTLVSAILGPRLLADSGEWGTYAWAEFVLDVPGMKIAGGTDEIMKNVIAERVLGLPR